MEGLLYEARLDPSCRDALAKIGIDSVEDVAVSMDKASLVLKKGELARLRRAVQKKSPAHDARIEQAHSPIRVHSRAFRRTLGGYYVEGTITGASSPRKCISAKPFVSEPETKANAGKPPLAQPAAALPGDGHVEKKSSPAPVSCGSERKGMRFYNATFPCEAASGRQGGTVQVDPSEALYWSKRKRRSFTFEWPVPTDTNLPPEFYFLDDIDDKSPIELSCGAIVLCAYHRRVLVSYDEEVGTDALVHEYFWRRGEVVTYNGIALRVKLDAVAIEGVVDAGELEYQVQSVANQKLATPAVQKDQRILLIDGDCTHVGALGAMIIVKKGTGRLTPRREWPSAWRLRFEEKVESSWRVGDRCWARWHRGRWYAGRIGEVHPDGTYGVDFDDGDVQNVVDPADIARANPNPPLVMVQGRQITAAPRQRARFPPRSRRRRHTAYDINNPVADHAVNNAANEDGRD